MNKKKLISLCLVLCLAAIAIVGGTMAYFTDTDSQKNTFTTGNVAIDLWEDFGDNDEAGIEELIPATGSAQAGTLKNGVEKEIYVTNDGSEKAFVRIHFAIPAVLDDGDPTFNASANTLHWNFKNYGNGLWNWTKTAGSAGYAAGDWNYYDISIDSSKLGTDKTVEFLESYIKSRITKK